MRELVRHIQSARKKAGFDVDDRIALKYSNAGEIFEEFKEEISNEVLASDISEAKNKKGDFGYNQRIEIDGENIEIWIKKE